MVEVTRCFVNEFKKRKKRGKRVCNNEEENNDDANDGSTASIETQL